MTSNQNMTPNHDVYYDQDSECWYCCTCDMVVCQDSGEGMQESDKPSCPQDSCQQACLTVDPLVAPLGTVRS
jgi:hypothetical protein